MRQPAETLRVPALLQSQKPPAFEDELFSPADRYLTRVRIMRWRFRQRMNRATLKQNVCCVRLPECEALDVSALHFSERPVNVAMP